MPTPAEVARLLQALEHPSSSVRLRAALDAGTTPDPRLLDPLLERCRVEPDFFVRDMLTWALTRQSAEVTVPRLVEELRASAPQARSQALHTLSKIGDRRAWPAITSSLLTAAEDEVARAAWRAAVVLVPEDDRAELAEVLATQLGRGGRELQLSLGRALISLGDVVLSVLESARTSREPRVRLHARATELLWQDPDAGFQLAVEEAKRRSALGPAWKESDADR